MLKKEPAYNKGEGEEEDNNNEYKEGTHSILKMKRNDAKE